MNWKKIAKYTFLIWVLTTILLLFLANRGLIRMYGGLTQQVDDTPFRTEIVPTIIENVHILSPEGKTFIPSQYVTLKDGIILSIDSKTQDFGEYKRVNGEGKFLIPGLTDAHIHLFKSPNDLLLYVANGITQIRELIGEEDHLLWKKEIEAGRIGPDMFVSSPRLGSFGTFEGVFMSWSQGFDNIQNVTEAEKAVKFYQEKGYDGIKIYSQLNKESYDAISRTAASLNMKVMGHIPFSLGLSDVYNSSQSGIAHFEEIMNALNREFGYYNWENVEEFLEFVDQRTLEIAQELITHDIAVTTSLSGTENTVKNKFDLENQLKKIDLEYVNPGLVEWSSLVPRGGLGWLPEVSRHQLPDNLTEEQINGRRDHWITYVKAEQLVAQNLIKSGVKIMVGTDANIPLKVPGFSLHEEFESLNNAGMSPQRILESATSIPAVWMETNTGSIEPGRKANLVLLDKNPLNDISNTRSIHSVILNGRVLNRNVLDQLLDAVKMANDQSRTKDISKYLK